MEIRPSATSTCCHWIIAPPKPWPSRRANSTMAASFGAAAKKATTGVGAPS